MAQRKPEKPPTVEEVLQLAARLTPEEQSQVVEELKLQWLRREVDKAEDQLQRGEGIPAEEVLAELRETFGLDAIDDNTHTALRSNLAAFPER